jgi:hypothetical protein
MRWGHGGGAGGLAALSQMARGIIPNELGLAIGLEPMACSLGNRRSVQLSYASMGLSAGFEPA